MNRKKPHEYGSEKSGSDMISVFPAPTAASPLLLEKRRVGMALRQIIDGLVTRQAHADDMAELATRLEAVAATFSAMPDKTQRTGFANRMTPEDVRDFIEFSPITGLANPVSPLLEIWVRDDQVAEGHIRFTKCFEGAPGLAHGGYVAAIFDELLGFVQGFSKHPGMTGTLTITYRAPTPLLVDLRLEGHYDGTEGRKIFTRGALYAEDQLLAEAKGIFIKLTEQQHAAVLQAHAETEHRRER